MSRKTPVIGDMLPGGRYSMPDLGEAGGLPIVIKRLAEAGMFDTNQQTVGGGIWAHHLDRFTESEGQDVVREIDNPRYTEGGMAILRGNLAPEGAVVKVAGVKSSVFSGPVKVYDREETAMGAVMRGEINVRRRDRDPLRGSEGRSRYARDAGRHQRAGGPGPQRGRGAHHGRPLQRREPRI